MLYPGVLLLGVLHHLIQGFTENKESGFSYPFSCGVGVRQSCVHNEMSHH